MTSRLELDVFKPLAGFPEQRNITSKKPAMRGMIVEGETSQEGVVYRTRIARNIVGSSIYGNGASVSHSVRIRYKRYPAIELSVKGYDDNMDRNMLPAEFVLDFVDNFKEFMVEDRQPFDNFLEYCDFVAGQPLEEACVFKKILVDLKDGKGVLTVSNPGRTRTSEYLEFSMPYHHESDYMETMCRMMVNKNAKDSKELKMLLKPFMEDLEKIV